MKNVNYHGLPPVPARLHRVEYKQKILDIAERQFMLEYKVVVVVVVVVKPRDAIVRQQGNDSKAMEPFPKQDVLFFDGKSDVAFIAGIDEFKKNGVKGAPRTGK